MMPKEPNGARKAVPHTQGVRYGSPQPLRHQLRSRSIKV